MRTAEHQILLIEDSPTDVTLLRAALARARAATYQLAVVAGLEEGLGRLAQEPVDAIVLDLGRTDSQGLERLRRLHAVAGDIPIVALAGWMDATAAERAVQAGAQEYVVKDTTGWASIPCIIHYAIERRRLIQLHKASENRFAIAFHHSPTGQAITTIHEGRFIDVNAAFCHMLGYQREEVIGRTTLELAIWADPEVRRAAFASFHREGSIQNWEVVFRTRTGDLRNILASVAPLEIDGEACAISTALDITARKRAADALQQSEARHRLISSAISDYVYSELVYADGRTRTEWVSGAFERITGYALEEVNAMPYGFLSLILADDAALIADRVSNLLDLPAAAIEYRIRRKDGEIRWVRDSMQQAPGAGVAGAARRVGAVQDITEHKVAEETIRSSERQMRALVSSLDDIVFEVDACGMYRNVWAANEAVLFRPRAEIIGKRFDEVFGEEASRPYFAYLERTLDSNSPQTLEYPLEVAGTQRWFVARYNPIQGHAQTYRSVSILVRDISEQKQAEMQLRESQNRSRAMLDAIPDMMYRLDRQGTFLDYKAEKQDLYAQEPPSLVGLRNREIAPAEFAALIERKVAETLATGRLQTFEFQLPIPDRSVQDYEARMSPSGADEVIAIVRNITERKQAEARLRASEQKLRSLLGTQTHYVVRIDMEGHFTYWNEPYQQAFGWLHAQASPANANPLDSICAYHHQRVHETVARCVARPGEVVSVELDKPGRDGSVRTSLWEWICLTDENNQPSEIQCMGIEITERKRAEALIYAQRDLARSIGTFKTVEDGFRTILETVLRLTGLDSGGIYLFTADAARLDLVYHHGLGAAFVQAVSSFAMDSRNVALILAGEPQYVAYNAAVAQNPLYQAEGLHALAVVPVLSQNRVIGCLNLASHSKEEVAPYSRQVLETLAIEIGNVVLHLQSQAALHASEEKYRSLVEATDAIIILLDADGRIQYMNEKAAEVSPIQIADAPGRTLQELLPREIADFDLTRLQAVIATGQGMVTESSFGEGRYLRISIQPVHDEHGAIVMALISATDITDLKVAQQELVDLNLSLEARVSERTAEVQDLYDNAPIGYHSLDADGRFIRVNQTELNWLGYTREEMLGHRFSDLLTPEHAETFHRKFLTLKQTGSVRDLEYDLLCQDGSILPGLVNATAIYAADGNFLMSRSTIFDNSQRRAAEQSLRESEQQNRLLFESAPDAVVLFDQAGRIVRANHAFELLSGIPTAHCIGTTMSSLGLLSEHDVVALASAVVTAMQQQGLFAASEFAIAGADGSPRHVGARIFGVTIQGRQHYLASMRDITVETQAAQTLQFANIELERALRMKDEFLANMSHELRTPLQGILGMSELLREQVRGPLNARQQKSIERIEESGRHLLALINDLLDISKIEAGKLELSLEVVSVDEICLASLHFVREMASKKQIQVNYANGLPGARLSADARRLKQMLVNLLSNAVKFTPNGGRVSLRVATDARAEFIQFAVEDTGPGIAPADQARLFQPFVQLDAQLSRQYEGTGLGLVLVKRLAEQHGGTVRLDSTGIPGQGSCFTITLPYTAVAPPPAADAGQPAPILAPITASPGGGPLLLLVEDNELNIEVLEDVLTYAGYRVVVARTGLEALELANTIAPDLILMDVQLPRLDGLEVTRRLRAQARFAATPIIALTASAMTGDRERCLAAGATDYMSKPIQMKALLEMIIKLTAPNRP